MLSPHVRQKSLDKKSEGRYDACTAMNLAHNVVYTSHESVDAKRRETTTNAVRITSFFFVGLAAFGIANVLSIRFTPPPAR